MDHVIFYGPPGLGKTTLSSIVAKELGANIRYTSGPSLTKGADLASILTNLNEKDVLFIDEIHRLPIAVEEILYSAMEDFVLDIVIGEGPAARSVRINLSKFTLIGATTRMGLISNPLRDRFGIPLRLEFYDQADLLRIITRGAEILSYKIEHEAAFEIAKRSRGTPRIALRLLKRVMDFAIYQGSDVITNFIASDSLDKLNVDQRGLDANDIRYIKFILNAYDGGPVGIDTIASAMSEQKDVIEDIIEPYLIQIGLVHRTKRGRVLTSTCLAYFT
jgi:Holliday junction DNA helicase RuvB